MLDAPPSPVHPLIVGDVPHREHEHGEYHAHKFNEHVFGRTIKEFYDLQPGWGTPQHGIKEYLRRRTYSNYGSIQTEPMKHMTKEDAERANYSFYDDCNRQYYRLANWKASLANEWDVEVDYRGMPAGQKDSHLTSAPPRHDATQTTSASLNTSTARVKHPQPQPQRAHEHKRQLPVLARKPHPLRNELKERQQDASVAKLLDSESEYSDDEDIVDFYTREDHGDDIRALEKKRSQTRSKSNGPVRSTSSTQRKEGSRPATRMQRRVTQPPPLYASSESDYSSEGSSRRIRFNGENMPSTPVRRNSRKFASSTRPLSVSPKLSKRTSFLRKQKDSGRASGSESDRTLAQTPSPRIQPNYKGEEPQEIDALMNTISR